MKKIESMPLVTAIIPTFNRIPLVFEAIDSVLAQTYKNIEIVIVVDNNDIYSYEEIKERYGSSIRIYLSKLRAGGSGCRNIGVDRSKGEWIAFLDDDDAWLPEKISKQIEFARRLSFDSLSVISAKIIAKSPMSSDIWPRRFPDDNESISEYLLMRRSLIKGDAQIQTSSIMISRSLLLEVKFTENLKKHQDLDLYLKLDNIKGVKFVFIDEPLSIWRIENTSVSVSKISDWKFSRDWALNNKRLFKGNSLSGFIASQAALDLTGALNLMGKIEAIFIMIKYKARPIDYLIFINICMLPANFRRRISQYLRTRSKGVIHG